MAAVVSVLSQAEDSQAAIRTEGLTRRFGELVAVDRLDLRVRSGIIYGLLGPNGAGKSTTIKMLITLLPPSEGQAEVAGHDIVREPRAVRRHIGYVSQLLSADGGLTGYENLMLSARLYGVPRRERRTRIDEALATMGLAEAARRVVNTYSGGMVRRLEIAQATLHHPAVLILDEPTIGLDPIARRGVWEQLRQARRAGETTVLLTTHDMEEADALCDEVGLIARGRLAAQGTPTDLKHAIGPAASLDDVFARYGDMREEGGSYGDIRGVRRTAERLG
jgi:ABC-2 type transport system ATP-binding protein